MPTSYETIPNRPLSGDELHQILVQDVDSRLSADGLLSPHIGFSQVAYRITIELQMVNPAYPTHKILIQSRAKPSQTEEIKPFPLPIPKEDEETIGVGLERKRRITNPNRERIKRGMPVTVSAVDPRDGHIKEHGAKYGVETLGEGGGDLMEGAEDSNVTEEKRKEWGWDK